MNNTVIKYEYSMKYSDIYWLYDYVETIADNNFFLYISIFISKSV